MHADIMRILKGPILHFPPQDSPSVAGQNLPWHAISASLAQMPRFVFQKHVSGSSLVQSCLLQFSCSCTLYRVSSISTVGGHMKPSNMDTCVMTASAIHLIPLYGMATTGEGVLCTMQELEEHRDCLALWAAQLRRSSSSRAEGWAVRRHCILGS